MNERYLFRGKYAGTIPDFVGKWVTGDCVYLGGKACIHPQNNITQVNEYDITKLLIVHPVVSETLGQYTGLRDKNGTLIFEGDIVSSLCDDPDCGIENYRVVFENYGWELRSPLYDNQELRDFVNDYTVLEVIGNIHDNPELLKDVTI